MDHALFVGNPEDIVGDRLYGRGTCDTKGSLAAMLVALETLLARWGELHANVLLLAANRWLGLFTGVWSVGFIAASLLGKHGADRRIARDDGADLCYGIHPGFERDGRRHYGSDPEIALFQLGQEFGAKP